MKKQRRYERHSLKWSTKLLLCGFAAVFVGFGLLYIFCLSDLLFVDFLPNFLKSRQIMEQNSSVLNQNTDEHFDSISNGEDILDNGLLLTEEGNGEYDEYPSEPFYESNADAGDEAAASLIEDTTAQAHALPSPYVDFGDNSIDEIDTSASTEATAFAL